MMQQNEEPAIQEFLEEDVWSAIKEFLNYGLHLGEGNNSIHITVGLLLALTLALVGTHILMRVLRKLLTRKMDGDDKLKFISFFKYIKYLVYVAVLLLTMGAAGIDITLLITASAALFVGIGLALQELIQDIIAGVLILIDKSLRVGDIVEVEGKVGKIFEIKLRTSRALTRDDKVLIIPNHKFISDVIYNYTQNRKTTREGIRVGVAYGSDVELVTELLKKAVESHKGILKNPSPFVTFDDFGDSALLFTVNFFIKDAYTDPRIKSDIRYRIDKLFRANKVTIPFPQRDVHFFAHSPMRIEKEPGEQ